MFCYLKKIIYLSLYEQEKKIGSAGFVRIYGEKDEVCFHIQIKNAGTACEGAYPVYLMAAGQEINIGILNIKEGCGHYERKFSCDGNKVVIGGFRVAQEEFYAVQIRLQKDRVINGEWKKILPAQPFMEQQREEQPTGEWQREDRPAGEWQRKEQPTEEWQRKEQPAREGQRKEQPAEEWQRKEQPAGEWQRKEQPTGEWQREDQPAGEWQKEEQTAEKKSSEERLAGEQKGKVQGEELKAVSISSDKWEQLKQQYKTVHPFEDDREFISIGLKDFVVLRDAYQRLANNSFLLHGFYNYRHLILGKDYQIGMDGETCFYLGVPGVFFEREKMVAVMFGFEGFESAGPVEIGKFGYYLRRVEI